VGLELSPVSNIGYTRGHDHASTVVKRCLVGWLTSHVIYGSFKSLRLLQVIQAEVEWVLLQIACGVLLTINSIKLPTTTDATKLLTLC
jgi:hypothetical protein